MKNAPTPTEKSQTQRDSYEKKPYNTEKSKNTMWQHKNAIKVFDYTKIADRLRTVSMSNDSHLNCMAKPVYGITTFPIPAKLCNQKDTHLKNVIILLVL